ncbi:hypothetical protein [Micromonospora sp. WMMD1082]|uniref:hypothetical protein n=1 Tax=Micromonospora sp. WMMD1082 TaxID=3016104 RepID=UPI002416DEA7|nr:hypothetical protein [Micromonospora sp. WMMD1082]MDG4792438.1 hypothetical protein [Micromonospora sp. WMMD1082]
MSNLPFTLSGCDQPATIRIEVYSAADGRLHGSLDAVVYACDRHGIEAVSATQAAGLTAHRDPDPTAAHAMGRTCGHVFVFPTGSLATPDHPAWCDQQGCQRRREHCSPVVEVDGVHREPLIMHVMLIQAIRPGAEPMLSMTVVDGGDRAPRPVSEHMMMPLDQAAALTDKIRALIDAAKGGQR